METKKEGIWKLKDVIFVTMLCVVLGVVYLAAVYLISPLTAVR